MSKVDEKKMVWHEIEISVKARVKAEKSSDVQRIAYSAIENMKAEFPRQFRITNFDVWFVRKEGK